jgi:hypothetical protein
MRLSVDNPYICSAALSLLTLIALCSRRSKSCQDGE